MLDELSPLTKDHLAGRLVPETAYCGTVNLARNARWQWHRNNRQPSGQAAAPGGQTAAAAACHTPGTPPGVLVAGHLGVLRGHGQLPADRLSESAPLLADQYLVGPSVWAAPGPCAQRPDLQPPIPTAGRDSAGGDGATVAQPDISE